MLGLGRSAVFRLGGAARLFCADADLAARDAFLASIARPLQGIARAKQSAAKRSIDFLKPAVASRLEGFDTLDKLLRATPLQLKKLDLPVKERRRLLSFANKYKQGWIPGPATPQGWRKLRPPPDWVAGKH